MTHDIADFEAPLWEGLEYFPLTIDPLSRTMLYPSPRPSARLSFQQTAPAVPPTYESYVREPWAIDGSYPSMSGPTQHTNHPEIGLVRDNISTLEPKNIISGSVVDLEDSLEVPRIASKPLRQLSKEKRRDSRRAGHSPRSRRAPAKANSGTVGQFKCGWIGCSSKKLYSHNTSLWRHIKEKHLFPNAFKCPTPHCDRSFGRNDKLSEHRRSVHPDVHSDVQAPRQGNCHSCHEESHAGCWS